MMRVLIGAVALGVASFAMAMSGPDGDWDEVRYKYWPRDQRADYQQIEAQMLSIPSAEHLSEMHTELASVPHPAGSVGDALTVDRIADLMESFGLTVERHPIWVYLSKPIDAKLEIISPERIELSLKERPIPEDPDTANEDLSFGWNAYSGSGDVFGNVVYANYATVDDFARLEQLGVQVTGRIVIARYGQIFRGLKAKHAEEAGAIGLILYTDPEDAGWGKGHPWPKGGYANETSIQRGGLKTLAYPGDPLTPKQEATQDQRRVDEYGVELPTIPVQPIGWGAAQQILSRMAGTVAPSAWQGGLPFPYALEGGDELQVRLMVEQEREIVQTWNVIGTIEGTGTTSQEIFMGSHHDAWGFGAADPLSGTICMLEAARTFGEIAKTHPPYRTLKFCAWAAEEHGLIGSTEYVESRAHFMGQWAVAYINLDMSAMGPDFRAMASPSIRTLIGEAARDVPQAGDPSRSVYDAWVARSADSLVPGEPAMGDVGGGSDHLPFWGEGGMPVCGLGAGGAEGTSYHTNYDTLHWYRTIVGDDYEPALMVTRMANLVMGRLAYAPVLPLDPRRTLIESRAIARELGRLGMANGMFSEPNGLVDDGEPVAPEMARLIGAASQGVDATARAYDYIFNRVAQGTLTQDFMDKLSQSMLASDRQWVYNRGIPERDWFNNLYSLPDEQTGYGASTFPWMRTAIRRQDLSMFVAAEIKYLASIVQASQTIVRAEDAVSNEPMPGESAPVEVPVSPGG